MNYVVLSGGIAEGLSSLWNWVCCRDPHWGGRSAWHIHARSRALQRLLGSDLVLAGPAGLWQCCVAQQEPVWVQLGWSTATTGLCTALACPFLQRVTIVHHTAGSNMPAHMKMLLAGQSWALGFALQKSLDNLISGCPWLLVTAKACPVVNVLHFLQPYLKVSADLHLYDAWTTKVLVFQFQSCKCYLKSWKAER